MRTAKKVVWIVLALLPIFSFLFILLGQIGQQKAGTLGVPDVEVLPIWTDIIISEDISGVYTIENVASDYSITLTEIALYALTSGNPYVPKESVLGAFLGLYDILNSETHIPAPTPIFLGMIYLFYLAFLELVSLLIDFILFVPRKCGEIFH